MWLVQETTLSFLNSQQLKSGICLNFMLGWFPSMGANKAFWRWMSTVLAWPIACHSGPGALGQASGAMHCYGCHVPCLGNIVILL